MRKNFDRVLVSRALSIAWLGSVIVAGMAASSPAEDAVPRRLPGELSAGQW